MKNLIIINGAPGVGKTTTCMELREILPKNVFLDGDWCWYSNPFIVTDETKKLFETNLSFLLNSFIACSEFENIILSICTRHENLIQERIDSLDMTNTVARQFILQCPKETRIKRIKDDSSMRKRRSDIFDNPKWETAFDHMPTQKIDTTSLTAKQVAEIIKQAVMK